jgi:hypothetical protein
MAFARSGLCRVGGSGTGGSTWQYSSADLKLLLLHQDTWMRLMTN